MRGVCVVCVCVHTVVFNPTLYNSSLFYELVLHTAIKAFRQGAAKRSEYIHENSVSNNTAMYSGQTTQHLRYNRESDVNKK